MPKLDAITGVGTDPYSVPNPESKFEWHDDKNLTNVRRHGIRFEAATRIFDSDVLVLRAGTGEEDRWKATDLLEGKVITVVFAERSGRRRLISARPASRGEGRAYN